MKERDGSRPSPSPGVGTPTVYGCPDMPTAKHRPVAAACLPEHADRTVRHADRTATHVAYWRVTRKAVGGGWGGWAMFLQRPVGTPLSRLHRTESGPAAAQRRYLVRDVRSSDARSMARSTRDRSAPDGGFGRSSDHIRISSRLHVGTDCRLDVTFHTPHARGARDHERRSSDTPAASDARGLPHAAHPDSLCVRRLTRAREDEIGACRPELLKQPCLQFVCLPGVVNRDHAGGRHPLRPLSP